MNRLLAVLAAMLMLLAACSKPEPPPEPQGTGSTLEDELALDLHLGGEPSTIDPAYATADDGGSYVLHLFEGLTALDKDGAAAPAAAESWEVAEDDDGLPVYTFTLRQGMTWSDGAPVKAEDFLYAWLRVLDPEKPCPNAYQLYPIQNAQRYREGVPTPGEDGSFTTEMSVKAEEVGIQVTEEGQLKVTLAGPCPDFLELLATPAWCPVRQDVVEADPATWTQSASTCVTNGRYMLKEWNHDQNLVLVQNDQHWDKQDGAAFLNFVLSEDPQAVYNDFAAGRLQYASALPTLDRETEAAAGTFAQRPRAGVYYYLFNTAKAPFDDARVRRAVSLAIDRSALVQEGVDLAPAYSLVPDGIADTQQKKDFSKVSAPISGGVSANLATAQKLLAEAGYPGGAGFPQLRFITNDTPAHLAAAEKVREQLAENLGIDMAISALSTSDFQKAREGDGWDMARAGMVGSRTDPAPYLEGWSAGGAANPGGFSSEQYDRLMNYSRTAPETPEELPAPEETTETQQPVQNETEGEEEEKEPEPLRMTRMETLHAIDSLLVAEEAAVVPLWQYREPALTARGLTGVVETPLGYRIFSYTDWAPPVAEEDEEEDSKDK